MAGLEISNIQDLTVLEYLKLVNGKLLAVYMDCVMHYLLLK